MPAVSKAQQRFMGMVHATQQGDMETPSKDVKTVAKSISKQDAKDFASTPHKGLPDNIKEMILSELRSIGIIQKEYFSVIDDIKKTLSAYKDNKGTDKEKQIVSKLKLLNDKKKKLSDEMDGKVSSMYKDAELKVDEASTTASADGYATPYAFSKPNQTKNKNNKLARVSGGTLVDELDETKRFTNKLKLLKELNAGDTLTHKHNSKIEIELIEPTTRGWKVYQTENGKRKIAYFDKQDITGPNAIFASSFMNENRWIDIKNEDSPATTKVNKGISNINKQLAEIEKFLGWYGKLKSENGLGNEDLWKRTNSHIYSIKERLLNLERKLRKISE
jgi:BMFP domain-containing protein YqiC